MTMKRTRRDFLKTTGTAALAMGAGRAMAADAAKEATMKRSYDISLAAWSLHKTLGKGENQRPFLDMPKMTRQEWDIGAMELVSGMLASDEKPYLDELAKNAADNDVKILLIMIDGQGDVGARSERFRETAINNHKHWIDIAADFGCHSVRMNWGGAPKDFLENPEALKEFTETSVPGFRAICDHGDSKGLNVIIENHWGPSSYIEPLTSLMKAVDHPRFGILPDFGNFPEEVDKYAAVDAFMPYAKAVSAKCYDFDDTTGDETKIDYERMIGIVCDKHGYDGHIGIEYEGSRLDEAEGIERCKDLLVKLRG